MKYGLLFLIAFLFFSKPQFSNASEVAIKSSHTLAVKDGYYTDGIDSRCTFRVTGYQDSGMVALNTSDSVDGYFCNRRSETDVFKCDKSYLCANKNGDTLYILGKNRLVVSKKSGEKKDLIFAASQIPAANKLFTKSFYGWQFSYIAPNCQTKSGDSRCLDLGLKDVQDQGFCKMAIQQTEIQALQICQKKNFSHCKLMKNKSWPAINERHPYYSTDFLTGCWGEVLVQGSK